MTKEKWFEIKFKEFDIASHDMSLTASSPENWKTDRECILNYVKAVDEATEVYNMENGSQK